MEWLYYVLDLLKLNRFATGQAQPGLSVEVLNQVDCSKPLGEEEQRQIADCLSCLDACIHEEIRKLDALKTHKQGLMQQLFPAEGQCLPRLRFPGFEGEWDIRNVGDVMSVGSSKRVHESDWVASGVPFYRARELVALAQGLPISPLFIDEGLYERNIALTGELKSGHLLVTGVGSIGVPYMVKEGDRFYFKDGSIIWLKNDEETLLGSFLRHSYLTPRVQSQIATMAGIGTVGTYTIESARKTEICFPSNKREQRKISDFLSLLDELIVMKVQKVAALKRHKNGLMHGLFPTMNVDAA
ncbi:hypothetical protein ATB53_05575 [Xanthomonas translucens]|uniref:Restriction endonuclease subunit S n=1 Tax=Xanthomonas campestris pv. translucens TaxID=343 RepID=A0A109HGW4_XANCT|nr:hypothetical protein ATB53_05575 [Xanthomonas translucens]